MPYRLWCSIGVQGVWGWLLYKKGGRNKTAARLWKVAKPGSSGRRESCRLGRVTGPQSAVRC